MEVKKLDEIICSYLVKHLSQCKPEMKNIEELYGELQIKMTVQFKENFQNDMFLAEHMITPHYSTVFKTLVLGLIKLYVT